MAEQQNKEFDDSLKDSNASYAMIAFGFGEVIGGLVMGLVNDKIGNKKTSIINVVLVALCFAVTLYNIHDLTFDWSSYLMCFLWGI
jgi:predicted MFS family arabinose efflux permease